MSLQWSRVQAFAFPELMLPTHYNQVVLIKNVNEVKAAADLQTVKERKTQKWFIKHLNIRIATE